MLIDWFQHGRFAYPWFLPLLLLLPYLAYTRFTNRNKHLATFKFTTVQALKTDKRLAFLQSIPFVLRLIALFCLIIALCRPQNINTVKVNTGEGIDIMLCFDISGSMTATDLVPNRLEAAKAMAKDFVSRREGDEIGVVIFSNKSFTLCPLTTDHNAVISQIEQVANGYLLDDGTAIGSGIATCVARLKSSHAKTKIIILLTDGVDVGGTVTPETALEMSNIYGIKIYTIGVGTENPQDWDSTGLAKVPFDENMLQKMASTTGGQYFHAIDRAGLEGIYHNIDQLEKSRIQQVSYTQYQDLFVPLIMAGFLLVTLEFVLNLTVLKKFP